MSIMPEHERAVEPESTEQPSYLPDAPVERSPVITGIISAILPGFGHIYAGKVATGLGYFALALMMIGLIFWVNVTIEFTPFDWLMPVLIVLAALFWLWQLLSAIWLAGARKFTPSLGLILVLVFTYLIGWQATEVNLKKFFTEFPDTFRIFTLILWPWEASVERELDIVSATTDFANPCEEGQIPEQVEGGAEFWVMVDPACGVFSEYILEDQAVEIGTELTVRGGGFEPGKLVEIYWEDPIGEEFRPIDPATGELPSAIPDENGEFEVTFNMPQYLTPAQAVGVQIHEVQARQVAAIGKARMSENMRLALERMIVTIFQALMATSLGIIFAVPVSFIAARNLMQGSRVTIAIYYGTRFVLNVIRSIEPIIWAVIAVVWVGLGPFAGVLALMVHTIAALGKLYSEAIESIDSGPIEAITATGANRLQTIMYAIVPQIIPPFLSFTIYRWDINVRMSTIIGFVGGGGIGQILFQWINQSRWSAAGIAVWLIAFTVSVMDYGSAELRKRFI